MHQKIQSLGLPAPTFTVNKSTSECIQCTCFRGVTVHHNISSSISNGSPQITMVFSPGGPKLLNLPLFCNPSKGHNYAHIHAIVTKLGTQHVHHSTNSKPPQWFGHVTWWRHQTGALVQNSPPRDITPWRHHRSKFFVCQPRVTGNKCWKFQVHSTSAKYFLRRHPP